ncbi:MAG TPA: hypothetical protein VF817_03720 [Patescibacteria group bacterium]
MQLTDKQIEDFQLLWKNRFGYDLPRKEAFEQGTKLVRLMELIYQPMTVSDYEIIQKMRAERINKSERLNNTENSTGGRQYVVKRIKSGAEKQ